MGIIDGREDVLGLVTLCEVLIIGYRIVGG